MKSTYAIGIDFGTESGRTVLVDVADGREIATAVHSYANGVIADYLPDSNVSLGPDWALQDPQDYIATLQQAIPQVLAAGGVQPEDVIGIGVDCTACTMLPVLNDGTPFCQLPEYCNEPHAWVKLWKHHAAQPEADRINEIAQARKEPWLSLYGGRISSEWFFSKALQILEEAPRIYHSAHRLIEAADWIVWRLTGQETRNACCAGYKAMWQKGEGFPARDFFAALHPDFADVVDTKMKRAILPLGSLAGRLTPEAAAWTGLRAGTAVAVGAIDAHATVPAAQATTPGIMTIILGTSNCHMVLSERRIAVPGISGVVADGIVPDYFGYEAGQAAVGDIFAWFIEHGVPAVYHEAAAQQGVSLYAYMQEAAAQQPPGAHGLLALDWWNGCRSTLVDADLSGLLVGATLSTTAPDIYRALLESTAFGTRKIIETFVQNGVPVDRIVAAGGLAERNPLLMQIYADVTGREFSMVRSEQASALGAAMHGAVAAGVDAGGYASLADAAQKMGGVKAQSYQPIPAHQAIYDRLYHEYARLYEYFGQGETTHGNAVMKRLRELRRAVLAAA